MIKQQELRELVAQGKRPAEDLARAERCLAARTPIDAAGASGEGSGSTGEREGQETGAGEYHELAGTDTAPVGAPKRSIDFAGKLYLAPLTTVGNLPFRRLCKEFGVDITCGEMAMATNLLQGQASEWALLRRHASEDIFGVQLAGNNAESMGRAAQLIDAEASVDFIDINMGCPIDVVCNRGCGAALGARPGRIQQIVRTMSEVMSMPLTMKIRMGCAARPKTRRQPANAPPASRSPRARSGSQP